MRRHVFQWRGKRSTVTARRPVSSYSSVARSTNHQLARVLPHQETSWSIMWLTAGPDDFPERRRHDILHKLHPTWQDQPRVRTPSAMDSCLTLAAKPSRTAFPSHPEIDTTTMPCPALEAQPTPVMELSRPIRAAVRTARGTCYCFNARQRQPKSQSFDRMPPFLGVSEGSASSPIGIALCPCTATDLELLPWAIACRPTCS